MYLHVAYMYFVTSDSGHIYIRRSMYNTLLLSAQYLCENGKCLFVFGFRHNKVFCVGFHVPTAASLKMTVFWD
jgi:hypothetical protein